MGLKVRSAARPKHETGILLQIGVRTRWMLGQKVLRSGLRSALRAGQSSSSTSKWENHFFTKEKQDADLSCSLFSTRSPSITDLNLGETTCLDNRPKQGKLTALRVSRRVVLRSPLARSSAKQTVSNSNVLHCILERRLATGVCVCVCGDVASLSNKSIAAEKFQRKTPDSLDSELTGQLKHTPTHTDERKSP